MTPRYLVRATERTKLSFIDMGKTMDGASFGARSGAELQTC